jgi:hypothetical protein
MYIQMKKWITVSEFVDIDTGEMLNFKYAESLKRYNYRIINKIKKYNHEQKITKIINECRHTGQREIKFAIN